MTRRVLVCGASAGIGRATAELLARRGWEVLALARRGDALEALVPQLRAAGAPRAAAVVADLDDRPGLHAAVDAALADGPIHAVVNNTGGPPGGPLVDAAPDAILAAVSRHLLAAHQILQQVLPGMRAGGFGRFVQVLSTSVREPIDNLGVSNLTRAAVASWAKTLSRELPPGVTINNVLPGYTRTDRLDALAAGTASRTGVDADAVRADWIRQIPEGRLGRADEIASVIAFLCSEEASYVRGATLPVDGGRLRSI